jgi:2-dehydro-3-deoxyphosphogluconate aldolase/(4S)-4-hydroxy-2-oxoglutarate aldolase
MNKQDVLAKISEIGIVPVVRAETAEQAIAIAEAIQKGGIPIAEITMTVPGAVEVIATLRQKMGDTMLIGAGTVLDAEDGRRCLDAGAQFLVSPGFDRATVQLAHQSGVLIMAGALTPTEVITAWRAGADIVKIFPCGNVGGARYLKALKGPLPQVPMVPTGGVNLTTASEFIKAGAVALGIGGELASAELVAAGNFEEITHTAAKFLSLVRSARL